MNSANFRKITFHTTTCIVLSHTVICCGSVPPTPALGCRFGPVLSLPYPELHHKFLTERPVPGVRTVFGVAVAAADGVLVVSELGGGAHRAVPFDYLVAATGFAMPSFFPAPGQTLPERRAEVKNVQETRSFATFSAYCCSLTLPIKTVILRRTRISNETPTTLFCLYRGVGHGDKCGAGERRGRGGGGGRRDRA